MECAGSKPAQVGKAGLLAGDKRPQASGTQAPEDAGDAGEKMLRHLWEGLAGQLE